MEEADPADVVRDLRDTERRRLQALTTADIAAARTMHAPGYELINPAGEALSGAEYLRQIATRELIYHRFEPTGEIAVLLLGTRSAVVRYRADVDVDFPGGHDAGQIWHTDIYERRDDRWQAVWSQATRIVPTAAPQASV